ncbi:MAG: HAMP domain-containing sensor histidine kinase, partial [Nitrospirota bacterium]
LLQQIDEQTDRAKSTVRSLLEFSRDKEFKKEMIPLRELFEETILFLKGQIPARVEIIFDIPEGVDIFADKQRIQHALLNLIKNAVESIVDEGKVCVRARKHLAGALHGENEICDSKFRGRCIGDCQLEQDTVDIVVEDTGVGIPADMLPRVFDPFFTTKDVGKGSGLGLFITTEIVEEHNGCMGVDSKVGEGTCFLIRLPLKE